MAQSQTDNGEIIEDASPLATVEGQIVPGAYDENSVCSVAAARRHNPWLHIERPAWRTTTPPLRERTEFKMVKRIAAIEFVHDVADLGAGKGGYNEDHEFYGYRMPI